MQTLARTPAQPAGDLPSGPAAQALAVGLLGEDPQRLLHVRTAGLVAARLSVLFGPREANLLVVAASLHDIGYSPRIAHHGVHQADGAAFLRAEGYDERLVRLVAHHSLAHVNAAPRDLEVLAAFPREDSLLADALAYADMHAAPGGGVIRAEARLADIAARHPDPAEARRAQQLRAALVRVGRALHDADRHLRPVPHEG
jgi:hypothetical protein